MKGGGRAGPPIPHGTCARRGQRASVAQQVALSVGSLNCGHRAVSSSSTECHKSPINSDSRKPDRRAQSPRFESQTMKPQGWHYDRRFGSFRIQRVSSGLLLACQALAQLLLLLQAGRKFATRRQHHLQQLSVLQARLKPPEALGLSIGVNMITRRRPHNSA